MKYQLRSEQESEKNIIIEDWGSLTWLANRKISNSNITLGRVIIKTGASNPRHCHDSCEEVLYLLQGKLRHFCENEVVEMSAGDTLVVNAGVMHNAVNIGDIDADMIVAYSSGERDFRKET